MIILFIFLILIYFINLKFDLKNFNYEYLEKKNTTIINGLFVIIVFFSLGKIGQLMDTPFLFYSGYGI